jgi:hypothetical protein
MKSENDNKFAKNPILAFSAKHIFRFEGIIYNN